MRGSNGSLFVHACASLRKLGATRIRKIQDGLFNKLPMRGWCPRAPCYPSQPRRRQRRSSPGWRHPRRLSIKPAGHSQQAAADSRRQHAPASPGLHDGRSRRFAQARSARGTWRPRRQQRRRSDPAPPCPKKKCAYHLKGALYSYGFFGQNPRGETHELKGCKKGHGEAPQGGHGRYT